ncbi:MAG: hypothetical protein QOH89_203 [Pseudonocardiales bacterium]|nr:hypothetical protein [Pseudonocardiales bacterium]
MPRVPPSDNRPRKGSARDRTAAFRAAQRRAERRRRVLIGVTGAVVAAVATVGINAALHSGSAHAAPQVSSDTARNVLTGPMGPEGISLEQGELLAPASTAANGLPVDGIECNAGEQVAYHIHTHLTVYVDGKLRPIPAGVGIVEPIAQQTPDGPFDSASECYYWLHVHAQDGVIHIESPTTTTYTLGQFFAIWNQPLTAHRVGPSAGKLTVFVNGAAYAGNPADIPLRSHEDIQIDVGTPTVAAERVDWSKSQL